MQFINHFISELSLGLDISSTEIRLLVLRRKKQHIFVEKMTSWALPHGVIMEGNIQQPEILAAHVKMLVQDMSKHKLTTTIALPFQSVIHKKIILDAGETPRPINDYFPEMTDVLAYDYVDTVKERLFIAARQDDLMRYVNIVEDAGVKVSIVDVDLYALVRAVHFALRQQVSDDPVFVLELTEEASQFIVFNQYEILHQQVVQDSFEFSIILKRYAVAELKKIYLIGNKSHRLDLVEWMTQGIETEWIDVFDGMPHHFLVSCGLALRGITPC